MTVELSVLISLVCGMSGVVFGLAAFRRGARQDAGREGKNSGMLLTEMGYVKAGVDDIKREQREQARTNLEVMARLVAVEQETKQARSSIEKLEGRI